MLQTAGRKMAALTGCIFATSQTSIISKQDQKSGGKKLLWAIKKCFCFFCFFLLQLIDRACDGFRFSSPIMPRETKRNKTKNELTAFLLSLLLFCLLLLSFMFFVAFF